MAQNILVVDDEADVQELVRQTFRRQIRQNQYQFFFALNGEEALDKMRLCPDIGVILTDINMPVMDGLTLLDQVQEHYPEVYTIVISAYGDMGNLRQAMNAGAYDFLTKPVSLDDLQRTLDKTLGRVEIDRSRQHQLQQTQAQLVQGEKMSALGQLVAGVAHEINNPVNFIYGNIHFAIDYAQDLINVVQSFLDHYDTHMPAHLREEIEDLEFDFLQQDFPKVLNSMQVGAKRIQEIVLSLRNFSRVDQHQSQAFDLHQGLDDTLMILNHRLKANSDRMAITVIKDYGPIPLLECYASQINQVFMNLLGNAIDALDSHSHGWTAAQQEQHPLTITLTTAVQPPESEDPSAPSWVRVSIADNGPGIPPEVQRRLFEPFFTTKPVGKGTGLGLSISHHIIVTTHGGRFHCQSDPQSDTHHGTTFALDLPIAMPDPRPTPSPTAPGYPLQAPPFRYAESQGFVDSLGTIPPSGTATLVHSPRFPLPCLVPPAIP
ncbi:response regulator [Prochlorothrix hollandica]|uniref:response regulator n=1 Tax=Prochlorothrix hollandica TaxID=1223 RepID=UPI00334082E6